jgi:hypothetical protein
MGHDLNLSRIPLAIGARIVPGAPRRNSLKIPSTAGLFLPHASCRKASKDTRFAMGIPDPVCRK